MVIYLIEFKYFIFKVEYEALNKAPNMLLAKNVSYILFLSRMVNVI